MNNIVNVFPKKLLTSNVLAFILTISIVLSIIIITIVIVKKELKEYKNEKN